MKTYAPKGLHGGDLPGLIQELQATPPQICKFLKVGERTLRRWLADESAPFAALAALWHETPHGRHVTALDVGNELVIVRGLQKSTQDQATKAQAQLCRVLAIASTGAANDPLIAGPLPKVIFSETAQSKPAAWSDYQLEAPPYISQEKPRVTR